MNFLIQKEVLADSEAQENKMYIDKRYTDVRRFL